MKKYGVSQGEVVSAMRRTILRRRFFDLGDIP
jgi:hypothetical protein